MKARRRMTGIWVAAVWLAGGCTGTGAAPQEGETTAAPNRKTEAKADMIATVSPTYGNTVKQGESIRIRYTLRPGEMPDSVVLSIAGRRIARVDTSGYEYAAGNSHPTGRVIYKLTAHREGLSQERTGECTVLAAAPPRLYTYKILRSYPHDAEAYTQGLLWHDGFLYESTGLEGKSTLRRVNLDDGKVLQSIDLPGDYFGEGLERIGSKLYQLTWHNNKALVYDLTSFEKTNEFGYGGEGWGLATDGKRLYMSDGSEKIRILDPETFRETGVLHVYTDKVKVPYINEMEWIDGELWANVYTSDEIVRIDPQTGAVTGVVDLSGLLPETDRTPQTDVLNGIAYDPAGGRIFVTGKNWKRLFEIGVFPRK